MTIVEMKKMSKSFPEKTLFHDFDLKIEEHHIVAIVGQSGCGKSTLLNIIGGLESYESGEVCVFGRNLREYSAKEKRELYKNKIAFLFQNYALIEDETVRENLLIPIRHKNKAQQQADIEDVLKTVGLLETIDKKVYSLSGGEQQRIALARVLLKSCDLILADEPTGNLDPDNKKIIFDILKKLKEEKTILIVTHDLSLASECDDIIEL